MPPPPVHRSLLLVLALFLLRTTIAQLVVVSTYSSNACAPGGVPITTALACQTAATTLNIGYKDEIDDDEEPKGCGWYCTNAQLNANDGLCGLYFNTHLSGAPRSTTRTVCHVRPGPPKSVNVRVYDDDTLEVTIEPPLDDGGANITHYNITTDIGGPFFGPQTSSHSITNSEHSEKIMFHVPRPLAPGWFHLLLEDEMTFAADGSVTGGIESRTVDPWAPLDGGAFSFQAWVKYPSPTTNYYKIIFDLAVAHNNNELILGLQGMTGKMYYEVKDESDFTGKITTTSKFPTDQWVMVQLIYRTDQIAEIYWDGVQKQVTLAGSSTSSGTVPIQTDFTETGLTRTWYIGKGHLSSNDNNNFQGSMEQVAFLNREMTIPTYISDFDRDISRPGCGERDEICDHNEAPCNTYLTRDQCKNACLADTTCASYEWKCLWSLYTKDGPQYEFKIQNSGLCTDVNGWDYIPCETEVITNCLDGGNNQMCEDARMYLELTSYTYNNGIGAGTATGCIIDNTAQKLHYAQFISNTPCGQSYQCICQRTIPTATSYTKAIASGGCTGRIDICGPSEAPCNSYTTRLQCENGCTADTTCISYEWHECSKKCQLSTVRCFVFLFF